MPTLPPTDTGRIAGGTFGQADYLPLVLFLIFLAAVLSAPAIDRRRARK